MLFIIAISQHKWCHHPGIWYSHSSRVRMFIGSTSYESARNDGEVYIGNTKPFSKKENIYERSTLLIMRKKRARNKKEREILMLNGQRIGHDCTIPKRVWYSYDAVNIVREQVVILN